MLRSKKVCVIAVTVALCIGSNYALINVPNFKLMDFFVFISGVIFGSLVGASIGILIWLVYGVLNPYGFVPQIWFATMFSESVYGFVGGVIGRGMASTNITDNRIGLSFLFGSIGFFLTFLYDLITNIIYALTFNIPICIAIITGVPFAMIHELSNTVLFGICSIPLITFLEKFIGGERFGTFK